MNTDSLRRSPSGKRLSFPAQEVEEILKKQEVLCEQGLQNGKRLRVSFFDEQSNIIEVQTHNTDLKKRLGEYARQYPGLCRQTDDDGQGGMTFEIEKGRLSFRLTAPYSEERRSKASAWARERGIQAER